MRDSTGTLSHAPGTGQFVSLQTGFRQLAGGRGHARLSNQPTENHGNQGHSFWADRVPHLVENLSTPHVMDTFHWRTFVHFRDGSGGKRVLCAGVLALAVE